MTARQFTLMIVRKRYISPYRKYKYVAMDSDSLSTKRRFIKSIEEKSTHWRDATYFLMDAQGVFSRFDIKEGKVEKLYKLSPITELTYPCWEGFSRK